MEPSTKSQRTYTWDDLERAFIPKAANWAANRYRHYGVTYADVTGELYVWLYGKGKQRVERWLGNEPQQTTRIYTSLLDVAKGYAEAEKAAYLGYAIEDVTWYTPAIVEALLPYAKNPNWTGEAEQAEVKSRNPKPLHERGDFLAMVMDVRRALSTCGSDVNAIVDYLGERRPNSIGSRKAMSNAQARAITEAQS